MNKKHVPKEHSLSLSWAGNTEGYSLRNRGHAVYNRFKEVVRSFFRKMNETELILKYCSPPSLIWLAWVNPGIGCRNGKNKIGYGNAWNNPTKLSVTPREASVGKETMKGLLQEYRDGIFKLLMSQESIPRNQIPPVHVVWRAGTTNPIPNRFLAPIDLF